MLGTYPNATRPITALPRRLIITQVFAVLAVSGLGALAGTLTARGNMTLSVAGVGTFAPKLAALASASMTVAGAGALAPVLRASVFSQSTMQGSGTFGSFDTADRSVHFAGVGTFVAVSYAFFADAERACIHQELRTASVTFENRTARVPFEDRTFRVPPEPRGAGNQPRKRIC